MIDDADALAFEIDHLIDSLGAYSRALKDRDQRYLENLLAEGDRIKRALDDESRPLDHPITPGRKDHSLWRLPSTSTPHAPTRYTWAPFCWSRQGPLVRATAGGTRAVIVTDTNVGPLYQMPVKQSLESAGYEVSICTFEAGEAHKRAETYINILEFVAEHELSRSDVIVALGGGVVGDVAGFVAATYMRGCKFVQIPTSLLAMVDSSVGGKTAIDLAAGKNLGRCLLAAERGYRRRGMPGHPHARAVRRRLRRGRQACRNRRSGTLQ